MQQKFLYSNSVVYESNFVVDNNLCAKVLRQNKFLDLIKL